MMNNRGISAVVATVLIILITVAAVTIIWAAIIPMIKNNLDTTVCLDAVSQVSIGSEGGYTCFEFDPDAKGLANSGNVSVQVTRGAADFDLAGVQIIVSEGGDTFSSINSTVTSSGGSKIDTNGQVVLFFSYDNTTTAGPDKVEIAPIVSVGNTEKTCDVAASASLDACQP